MFDACTFLLLLLALVGRRWRRALLTAAVRRGRWLSAGLLALAGSLEFIALSEEQGLVSLALLEMGLIVAFLVSHTVSRRPWVRGASRLGVATAFHALFVLSAPSIGREVGQGVTPLWFVDLTASGWVTFIEPLLALVGADGASSQVLGTLTPGLVFLGAALVPFQFVWSYVALGWIARLVPPDTHPDHVAPEPEGLTGWVVGLFLVVLLWAQLQVEGIELRALSRGLAALFACHGAWWLFARLAGRCAPRWTVSLVAASAVVLFVYPGLWWLLGAVGVLEISSRRWRGVDEDTRHLTAVGGTWLRRSFGPTVLLGFALPLLLAGGTVMHLIRGAPAARSVAPPVPEGDFPPGSSLRVPGPDGRPFEVDRYEFPNERGRLPRVGVRPEVAQADCEARGARLCTAAELALLCASGREHQFLDGDDQGFFACGRRADGLLDCWGRSGSGQAAASVGSGQPQLRLEAACNFGQTADSRPRELWPSGSSAACRGDWAVYDLIGNAYEWATLPERPGFYALVGSDYLNDDLLLLTCGAYMLVPVHFIDHLDLTTVGSRCCR